jgi:hypothetical protein
MLPSERISVNTLLLLLIVCPLLGAAVFAGVIGLAFTVAWLLRVSLQRRSRSLQNAATSV